jgi:PAS domain S-box-containing protein
MAVVGGAIAVGVVYFLTARLGLALLASSGVAVFWPAAGVAAGILITLGRPALPALVIGVVAATVAANLLSDRNLLTALLKGFCNAGEPVLAAWLLKRWVCQPFTLGSLRRVLDLLVAAALAAAASAVAAAIIMTSLHTAAPFSSVWLAWFLSDGLGIVIVAPLLIACGELRFNLPSRNELVEGVGVLALLALTTVYVRSYPSESWVSVNPGAFTLPLLLWLAARCPPIFPIAGAFAISLSAIFAVTFGTGRLGDESVPLMARVHGVQITVVMVTAFTLVLIALFAERRRSEVELKRSAERLQLAMDAAELGAFSADLVTRDFNCDARVASIHGHSVPPTTLKDSTRFVHRDDLGRIDAALAEAKRTSGIWNVEYRVVHPPAPSQIGETRWVAVESSLVRDAKGNPAELIGVTRDITNRKRAEQELVERNAQLDLAGKIARIGRFTYDDGTRKLQISPDYAGIYGLPEGTLEISSEDWRALVHPDDLPRLDAIIDRAFSNGETEFVLEFRIFRHGEVRWIESRVLMSYNELGRAVRRIGANIDVTERKRAEERQRLLMAELDHRVKNTLATVSAVVSHTRQGNRSVANFAVALDGRIRSMATAHELLSSGHWQGIPLTELVRRELAPYATRNNTEINGPQVVLTPEAGQAMAIVLHELSTNAAKYGALSTGHGRVSIRWDQRRNGDSGSHLLFEWQEIGGPPVMAPGKPSYGTSTIRDLIPYEFGGAVDLLLAPEGVRCRLELPSDWLSNDVERVPGEGTPALLRASIPELASG